MDNFKNRKSRKKSESTSINSTSESIQSVKASRRSVPDTTEQIQEDDQSILFSIIPRPPSVEAEVEEGVKKQKKDKKSIKSKSKSKAPSEPPQDEYGHESDSRLHHSILISPRPVKFPQSGKKSAPLPPNEIEIEESEIKSKPNKDFILNLSDSSSSFDGTEDEDEENQNQSVVPFSTMAENSFQNSHLFGGVDLKDLDIDMNGNESVENISTVDPWEDALTAIYVHNVWKGYGPNKQILKGLSMEVKEGAIYALLGASGCGKTTLLSCILSLKKLDRGTIEIFGFAPGARGSGVPGTRFGYMPQELALFEELTIREVVYYFGRLLGCEKNKIEEKLGFLCKLLKLPDDHRMIRDCSGGQQRRVSFMTTLIHDAKILILDEPTVGVDPLLRQTLWDYLKNLVENSKTTIIVTTHYIEEATNASRIGIMRSGKLLVEESPTKLMKHYNASLDDIVLNLCLKDEMTAVSRKGDPSKLDQKMDQSKEQLPQMDVDIFQKKSLYDSSKNKVPWSDSSSSFITRLHALIIRNFIRMWRNKFFAFFLLFFPGAGVLFICLAIGGDVNKVDFGLVNLETEGKSCVVLSHICSRHLTSCHFTRYINRERIKLHYYDTELSAWGAVSRGETWGYVTIPKNFSKVFPISVNEVQLNLHVDATNTIVRGEIQKQVTGSFHNFTEAWLLNCTKLTRIKLPIKVNLTYGGNYTSFKEYVAPSVHLLLVMYIGSGLTGLVLILEKKAGMFERSLVAGVTKNEIVLSHFGLQSMIMSVQVVFSLSVIFYLYGMPCKGSLVLVLILSLLQGLIGVLLGFVISAICTEEATVLQLSTVMIMPLFMISGVMWPMEGMPDFLRLIANILPQALSCEAIRSIMSRGWGLFHPKVWPGFASSTAWIYVLIIIILFLNKITDNFS